jgi:hypothetical protein
LRSPEARFDEGDDVVVTEPERASDLDSGEFASFGEPVDGLPADASEEFLGSWQVYE